MRARPCRSQMSHEPSTCAIAPSCPPVASDGNVAGYVSANVASTSARANGVGEQTSAAPSQMATGSRRKVGRLSATRVARTVTSTGRRACPRVRAGRACVHAVDPTNRDEVAARPKHGYPSPGDPRPAWKVRPIGRARRTRSGSTCSPGAPYASPEHAFRGRARSYRRKGRQGARRRRRPRDGRGWRSTRATLRVGSSRGPGPSRAVATTPSPPRTVQGSTLDDARGGHGRAVGRRVPSLAASPHGATAYGLSVCQVREASSARIAAASARLSGVPRRDARREHGL